MFKAYLSGFMNAENERLNTRKVEVDVDQAKSFLYLMADLDELIEHHNSRNWGYADTPAGTPSEFSKLALKQVGAPPKKLGGLTAKLVALCASFKTNIGLIWARLCHTSK